MAKAVKAGIGIVFNAVASLGKSCWSAFTNLGPLFTKAWSWVKDIAGVISDIWDKVKGWIEPLWKFYSDYVKPVLDFVHDALDVVRGAILLIQGKLDALWEMVLKDVLGPLNDIINDVKKIWTQIADIVGVFNAHLAEQMRAFETSITAKYNAALDAIYDKTIGQVKELLDVPLKKLNELEALYNLYIKTFTDKLEGLGKLIEITFEKPQVLKRDVLFSTSMHWGADLWKDLFSGITPTKPAEPSPEMVQLQVDPLVDKYIQDIFAEKVEGWQDIVKREDEEIRESYYGEVIPRKTEIAVPKLPK